MLQRAARIHTSTKDTIQVQVQVQGETFTKYGVRNAAIYMSRWCFEHQQLAGGSISTILPSHHGGFCQPDIDKVPKEHIQAGSNPLVLCIPNNTFSRVEGRDNFTGTTTKYTPLTSTHTVCVWKIQLWQDTGISLRSSCWPFWVDASQYIGVRRKEVFGVFSPKSLFFHDIHNPEPALSQIRYLELNETAHHEILLSQPILRDGQNSIRDFFFLFDSFDDGFLKQNIPKMLGIYHQK